MDGARQCRTYFISPSPLLMSTSITQDSNIQIAIIYLPRCSHDDANIRDCTCFRKLVVRAHCLSYYDYFLLWLLLILAVSSNGYFKLRLYLVTAASRYGYFPRNGHFRYACVQYCYCCCILLALDDAWCLVKRDTYRPSVTRTDPTG